MKSIRTKLYTSFDKLTMLETEETVNFLKKFMKRGKKSKGHIRNAILYSMQEIPSLGGFVIRMTSDDKLVGTVVANRTGMEGYFSRNLIPYIAVHPDFEDKGVREKLLKYALKMCDGDVALYVEADSPEKELYENLGFESKHMEMRYNLN